MTVVLLAIALARRRRRRRRRVEQAVRGHGQYAFAYTPAAYQRRALRAARAGRVAERERGRERQAAAPSTRQTTVLNSAQPSSRTHGLSSSCMLVPARARERARSALRRRRAARRAPGPRRRPLPQGHAAELRA